MMITIALLFGSLFGGSEEPKPNPKFELDVRMNATIRGVDITVGDLCDVLPAGRDALTIAQLRFGPAPTIGFGRTVTRTELLQAIAAAGHDVAGFVCKGASECATTTQSVEVAAADIVESATAALQGVLGLEGGDVEFEAPTPPRRVLAPAGRRSLELRSRVKGGRSNPTFAIVDVDVMVDGEKWRSVPLNFKLTRFQQVLKATLAVRAGTPLGAENVQSSRERVTTTTGQFLTSIDQVAGMVARRALQPGQLLTLGDTTPPALIHQGETCTVVLTRGNVKVTARAFANHDAPLGGRITLTNSQSRAQITGVVAAPGTVIVHSAK